MTSPALLSQPPVLDAVLRMSPDGAERAPESPATRKPRRPPPPRVFPALADETRHAVDTEAAAHYLNRRPQTLRTWAVYGTQPEGLIPLRVRGRLCWPVEQIRRVQGAIA